MPRKGITFPIFPMTMIRTLFHLKKNRDIKTPKSIVLVREIFMTFNDEGGEGGFGCKMGNS